MHTRRMLTLMAALSALAWQSARAQQAPDLGTLVTDSLAAMNQSRWEDALGMLTQATDRFGRAHRVRFNPKEGVLWYRRGICELRLRKYAEAMKSFETCYRDFPNQGANAAAGGNHHHKMALLRWGEAAQGTEDWQQAIRLYKKFLEERDKVQDQFPQGVFHVNMAICHFKLGKIPEGIDYLEIAIKNKETFPTHDIDIFAGFLALVEALVDKRDEQALPYYDEALGRPNQPYRVAALFGRAGVHAGGGGEELAKAEADLNQVFADSPDKTDRERALYRLVEVAMKKDDFAEAEARAKLYLDREKNSFNKWLPEVHLLLAQSYDKRGMVNDALANYLKVWSSYMGYVTVSAPAMKRWMELSWERNLDPGGGDGKGDRQSAYEGGWRYIDLTKRFFDKMTEAEQAGWKEIQKLVIDYESRPETKPLEKRKTDR